MDAKPTTVKFLIVDDREANLIALEAMLRRRGLEILRAHSGEEALELLLLHDVALALIDVHMPDMDGFTLAELMRGSERSRHVPIIFVTAAPEEKPRIFRGYDAGAVDFLFKPIEPHVLQHKAHVFFELHRQRLELADTLRFNEMFIAAVSHELRNPLNTISLATAIILAMSDDPVTVKNAGRIANAGQNMTRLLDDLFDLARVRFSKGVVLERKSVDLKQVADRVVQDHKLKGTGREIIFRPEGDCTGEWDEGRFEQALSNLVGNAVRHGEPETAVTLTLKAEPDRVIATIHNHGCIDADVLPYIFDPFRSSDASRRRTDSLGLGLYIVKQIVLAHEGSIDVTSEESGTTFRIVVPKRPSGNDSGSGSP